MAIWCWALFECAFTPAAQIRSLPKIAWMAVIVLLAWVGAIGWMLFGRPPRSAVPQRPNWRTNQSPFGSAAGTNTRVLPTTKRTPIGPDDDPDFLRRL